MLIHLTNDISHLIKLSFNTPKSTRGLDALSPLLEDSMAMVAVAMREEERRGTRQRRGTRKRRVRNEWRNLILIGRKLLSVMTSNGAQHPPFGYAGVMMV
jgi:hypothetical protein